MSKFGSKSRYRKILADFVESGQEKTVIKTSDKQETHRISGGLYWANRIYNFKRRVTIKQKAKDNEVHLILGPVNEQLQLDERPKEFNNVKPRFVPVQEVPKIETKKSYILIVGNTIEDAIVKVIPDKKTLDDLVSLLESVKAFDASVRVIEIEQ